MNSTGNVSFEQLLGVEMFLPFEFTIGSVSVLLNTVLLYFIVCKTPVELTDYRYFLLLMTVFDLLFDMVVVFLVRPLPLFPFGGFVVMGPFRYFGQEFGSSISSVILVFVVGNATGMVTLAFMYRYVCVVKTNYRKDFMKWPVQAGLYAFGSIFTGATSLSTLFQRADLQTILGIVYVRFPQTRSLLDNACIIGYSGRNDVFLAAGGVGITLGIGLNTFIAISIVKHLRSFRSSMTEATYKMHLELTKALIIQTVSPIILLGIPIGLLCVALSACPLQERILNPVFGAYFILLISLHPLINAISTLYFVKAYRKLIARNFPPWHWNRNHGQIVMETNPNSSVGNNHNIQVKNRSELVKNNGNLVTIA